MEEQREYVRVKVKSILVSLVSSSLKTPVTGFLRDISLGGLKIQKISSTAQVPPGTYDCQFVLPNFGKIASQVEVVGSSGGNEKFGDLYIRMRFISIKDEDREKIVNFVSHNSDN